MLPVLYVRSLLLPRPYCHSHFLIFTDCVQFMSKIAPLPRRDLGASVIFSIPVSRPPTKISSCYGQARGELHFRPTSDTDE
jgi:hypothetical protein